WKFLIIWVTMFAKEAASLATGRLWEWGRCMLGKFDANIGESWEWGNLVMCRCVNFILSPAIAEGEGDGVLRVCGYLSNLIGFFNLTLNPSPKERDFGIVLEFGFYP